MKKLALFFAFAFLLAGCSDANAPGRHGEAAALETISGDGQSATVGTALPRPIVLRVVDSKSRAVPGAAVRFDVAAGRGGIDSATAVSNDSGLVHVGWTLGTAAKDEQRLSATLVSGKGTALVMHATATPDVPSALVVLSAAPVSSRIGEPLAAPPSIALVDNYGNAVPAAGIPVEATPGSVTGRHDLAGTTIVSTDGTGVAAFGGLTILGDTGSVSISFKSSSLTPTTMVVRVGTGKPSRLEPVDGTSPSGTVAQTGPPVRARVADVSGNAIAGAAVTFFYSATQTSTTTVADANGIATFDGWSLPNLAGSYQITASVGDLPALSFTVTARAGRVVQFVAVGSASLAGTAASPGTPLRVRAADAFGNGVSGETVTFAVSGGSVIGQATTDLTGVATLATWTMPTFAPRTYNITATLGSIQLQFVLTVSVGPPARLDIVAPSSVIVVNTVPITARVSDAGGNPVTAAVVNWQVASGEATLSSTTAVSSSSGSASTMLTAGQHPGPVVLRATASGVATNATIAAIPDFPFGFDQILPEYAVPVGTTFTATPRLIDRWGNPIPGAAITATVGTLASLTPATQITDAGGHVTLTGRTVSRAGTYDGLIRAPNGIGAFLFARAFGGQASMAPWGVTPLTSLTATLGQAPQVGVVVNEADGRAATGARVTFSVTPANGKFGVGLGDNATLTSQSFVATPGGVEGVVSVNWAPPQVPGTYTMTVTAPAAYANNVIVFTLTVVP